MPRDHSRKQGHRSVRIERTVAEVFECHLLPSLEDPLLQDLHVLSVESAGNLSCLRILVAPGNEKFERDTAAVQDALERAENHLRVELSGFIRIKRMPALRLKFLPLPISASAEGGCA